MKKIIYKEVDQIKIGVVIENDDGNFAKVLSDVQIDEVGECYVEITDWYYNTEDAFKDNNSFDEWLLEPEYTKFICRQEPNTLKELLQ